jgi:hypothetical protein
LIATIGSVAEPGVPLLGTAMLSLRKGATCRGMLRDEGELFVPTAVAAGMGGTVGCILGGL